MVGGDFPKSSGVAGQAAEQHPGAADHGGRSVGAADRGLRTEVGRRARRLWPRLGGVDLTGNLSARSAERNVRDPGGVPGIQLLADTEDATTGETVANWPLSPHNHHLPHSVVS
jgi:hypothetical protein